MHLLLELRICRNNREIEKMLKCLKRFLIVFMVALPFGMSQAVADDDGFDFLEEETDEFEDAGNDDIMYADDTGGDDSLAAESVSLNDGAGLVNVGGFDIAGIMLGMSFEDVYNLYHNQSNLYAPRKRNSLVYTIPQDWKYNLDYECRQSGVFQPNKLDKCIRGLARSRGLFYVSEVHLERAKTGETIDVYFTSNSTDNVVYRIVYNNDVEKLESNNPKFIDQREKRRLAFWKTVVQKYGEPNAGTDTWATSANAYDPKMTAYYDSLELVDEGRHAMDAANAAQQSRDNFRAKPYAF